MENKELKEDELRALISESIKEAYISEDEIEDVPLSSIDMPIKDKAVFGVEDSVGLGDDEMTDIARFRMMKDKESDDYEGDLSISEEGVVQVTMEQLQAIIKEGVQKLHEMEMDKLAQINQSLNNVNDESWDEAHREAQSQLRKKTIAFNNMVPREQLMSENENTEEEKLSKKESIAESFAEAAKVIAEAKAKIKAAKNKK